MVSNDNNILGTYWLVRRKDMESNSGVAANNIASIKMGGEME